MTLILIIAIIWGASALLFSKGHFRITKKPYSMPKGKNVKGEILL